MANRDVVLDYIAKLRALSGGVQSTDYSYSTYGEISLGCQCCKNGTWMCIFLGQKCNLKCQWCPNPEPENEALQVHGGIWKDQKNQSIEDIIYAGNNNTIKGISYSGGEPLLRIPDLVRIATSVSKFRKNVYQWIYTNGILLTNSIVDELHDSGISEIRLDLAATDYNEKIIDKIQYIAKNLICSVEVPVLEEHLSKLINLLPVFQNNGVTFLNLHDLYVPRQKQNDFKELNLKFNYKDPVTGHERYLPSIGWVHEVIYAAKQVAPQLHVNECTIVNAAHQWIAFRWQSRRLAGTIDCDLETYKKDCLQELIQRGITLGA